MHKDNAKDYLPLVQALAEGKTIQFRSETFGGEITWNNVENLEFHFSSNSYRIKPEPKKGWYRVALLRPQLGFSSITAIIGEQAETGVENDPFFIKWLTDRIEYEIPE